MGKGKLGVETNVIIRTPKREKVKCNCKKCMNYRKNVCALGRDLNPLKCKWFATLNDYKLSSSELKEIQNKNNISKDERKERANYNKGFGDIKVKTVDLSKYRGLK